MGLQTASAQSVRSSEKAPPWETRAPAQHPGQALATDPSLVPIRMPAAYEDCAAPKAGPPQARKSAAPRDIAGFAPKAAGAYPVFVYLTGTLMKFNGPEAQFLTSEMAKRGFFAVAVDYDNAAYPYCPGMAAKAKCIFDESSNTSAVAQICAQDQADCSKGIVVAGFSQGANLAALSGNSHSLVKAAYLLGHGDRALNGLDVSRCSDDAHTSLSPVQMRSVSGESDMFFGGDAAGVKKQLQKVVGLSCDDPLVCSAENGSGFHVLVNDGLQDGSADHCYFLHKANVYCSTYEGLDAGWQHGAAPWAATFNLDWLAKQAKKP